MNVSGKVEKTALTEGRKKDKIEKMYKKGIEKI